MLRKVFSTILVVGLSLAAGAVFAAAPDSRDLPRRYSSGAQDGTPVMATDVATGTTWSAWAYRWRGEYSIALSARDSSGFWSEPVFIGFNDGLDQISPSLAVDRWGNFYLAFELRESATLHMSALMAGATEWFAPRQVAETGEEDAWPTVRVIADRVVLGFRTSTDVSVLDWAPLGPPLRVTPDGVQDGPDGFPLPSSEVGDGGDEAPLDPGTETSEEPARFGKKPPRNGETP